MAYVLLVILGLCFGSFINALVWRIHEQSNEQKKKKPNRSYIEDLSITQGRSICPECKHKLGFLDLIPILSWIILGGKCRYCSCKISIQYPLVELSTVFVFVSSYIWWPYYLDFSGYLLLATWLLIAIGLIALTVYDLRWFLLPNRILYPITYLGLMFALIHIISSFNPIKELISTVMAVLIGGGLFYIIFQISKGKWIGGGDVKLGWMLGLVLGSAMNSLLMIFLASIIGTIISIPLLLNKRLKKSSVIPFGPFLIIGAYIALLFGKDIISWYQSFLIR